MSFLPLKLGRQGAGRSQHVQASKGGPGCKESGLLACFLGRPWVLYIYIYFFFVHGNHGIWCCIWVLFREILHTCTPSDLVFENGCVVRPSPLKEGKPNAVIVSDVYNVPKVTGSPRALVLFPWVVWVWIIYDSMVFSPLLMVSFMPNCEIAGWTSNNSRRFRA